MATAWLSSWLTDLSLSEYVVVFANAGYTTPEQCATIRDREALKSIGVNKLGHLNRLYRAIEKLGSEINGGGEGRGGIDGSSMTLPLSNSGRDGVIIPAVGGGGGEGGRATALHQSKSATMIPSSREGMCSWHSRKTGSQKTYMYTTLALEYVYIDVRIYMYVHVCTSVHVHVYDYCDCEGVYVYM